MAAGTGFAADKYDMYRPEIWSPRITRFLKEQLYAAPFFLDYSEDAVGTDTIHIPHLSDVFSASDVPTTSGTVDGTDISETKTDLEIDKWKAASHFITKFEEREVMRRPNVMVEYQKAMGYKLGRQLEVDILAHLASLTPSAGTSATDLVATNIETALGIIASNSIPKEECRIFMEPKIYWGDLMGIQKYYDASQFGKSSVPQGSHDLLYGVPLVITPNVPKAAGRGYANAIIHNTAIVHAETGVDFIAKPSENLRKKIIADLIYGTKLMHATRGVKLLATS